MMITKDIILLGVTVVAAISSFAQDKVYIEENGYVVMEAESTTSPLDLWEKKS